MESRAGGSGEGDREDVEAGVKVEWKRYYEGEVRRRVEVSGYEFQRERYWIERAATAKATAAGDGRGQAEGRGKQEGRKQKRISKNREISEWFYAPTWVRMRGAAGAGAGAKTTMVIGEMGEVGEKIRRRARQEGAEVVEVKYGSSYEEQEGVGYRIRAEEKGDWRG